MGYFGLTHLEVNLEPFEDNSEAGGLNLKSAEALDPGVAVGLDLGAAGGLGLGAVRLGLGGRGRAQGVHVMVRWPY